MLSPDGDPAAPAGSARPGGAARAGRHLADTLLFLAFIAFVLLVLDVASGWAISGLLHLGMRGAVLMSVAIAVPIGYFAYVLGRTALGDLGRRDPDDSGPA